MDRDSNKQDNNQLSDEEKDDEDEELENEENKTDLSIARSMEADEIKQRLLCKYNNSPGKSFFYKMFLALTFSVFFFCFILWIINNHLMDWVITIYCLALLFRCPNVTFPPSQRMDYTL